MRCGGFYHLRNTSARRNGRTLSILRFVSSANQLIGFDTKGPNVGTNPRITYNIVTGERSSGRTELDLRKGRLGTEGSSIRVHNV
jgi:hypothetical protein